MKIQPSYPNQLVLSGERTFREHDASVSSCWCEELPEVEYLVKSIARLKSCSLQLNMA